MVHGTVRGLFSILGALAMLVALAIFWLVWSLSQGPVSLRFLNGPLEEALSPPGSSLSVALDDTLLVWDRTAVSLELRGENVRIRTNGQEIASFPEMAMTLSGAALLRGTIAPSTVRLTGAQLHLQRDQSGQIALGLNGGSGPQVNPTTDDILSLLQPANGAGGSAGALGTLQRVVVTGADLQVDDQKLGTSWHASQVGINLLRTPIGLLGTVSLTASLGGVDARIGARGTFDMGARKGALALTWSGLRPDSLAVLGPAFQPLSALQLSTDGKVDFTAGLDGALGDVHFQVTGGPGTLDATQSVGQSWPVNGIEVDGSLQAGLDSLALDRLRVDFGGPVLALKGQVKGLKSTPGLTIQGSIDAVPLDRLRQLWPASLLSDPRSWVVGHMSRGRVSHAEWTLDAHIPAGAKGLDNLAVDRLNGSLSADGVTIDFMPPMPPARDASATATFDANGMVITIKGGTDLGMSATSGKMVLSGFSAPRQLADLTLVCTGSTASALHLIDSKPLGFATAVGIRPDAVTGTATVTLSAKFPLLDDLKFEQVEIKADADLSNLGMPKAIAGLDLSEGTVHATVDNSGMDMSGKAKLDGVATDIAWRENFLHTAPFRRRYQLNAALDDAARRALGLTGIPFQAPWLTGPVPASVIATIQDNGDSIVLVNANLADATFGLPDFDWSKPAGVAGTATAELALSHDQLTAGRRFAVTTTDGTDFEGSFAVAGGAIQTLTLARAKFGRTDVKGDVTFHQNDGGLDIAMTGAAFDAAPLLGSDHGTDNPDIPKRAETDQSGPPLNVTARIDKVYLSKDEALSAVSADLTRNQGIWHQAVIDAALPSGKAFHVGLVPNGAAARTLTVTSDDGGGTLQAFGLLSNVVGGDLKIDGAYDDAVAGHPLSGQLNVSNYRIVHAPLLAHLFNVASLTGVVDLLTGDGIFFTSMDVPFKLSDGVLELDDAHAGGPSVGITARGQIDMDHGKIALQGTLVPFYLVNAFFGSIPVIGQLLNASNGSGLIAMNYSMKGSVQDPDTTVNPLTVLTPGFLRGLFNIFGSDADTKVRPEVIQPAPAAPAAQNAAPAPQAPTPATPSAAQPASPGN